MRGRSASTKALFLGIAGLFLITTAPAGFTPAPARPARMAAVARPAVEPEFRLALADPDDGVLQEVLIQSVADSMLEQPYRIGTERRVVRVASGDTLLSILTRAAVSRAEAHAALAALEEVYEPRRLRIGQEVTLLFEHRGRSAAFAGVELMPDVESLVELRRDPNGGFAAELAANHLDTRPIAAAAVISSSLYGAASAAGIPDQVILSVIRAYSHAVDFQRDLQPGDRFEVLFEQDFHRNGQFARNGEVQYAVLTLSGEAMPIYRFESQDGSVDFYSRDGESIRRALLRTPVDGARLSSGFGMRHHPILGYSRMHRGVDFAAPTGTPIYAAGDGTVDFVGTHAGYGHFVRLRHSGTLSTAYGHLSRYAGGLNRGRHVRQGEVIGYVGSSGLATGPHLHFEVLVDGDQVNPMSVDLRTGRKLEGRELAAFRRHADALERRFAELVAAPQVAATPDRN